MEHLPFSQIASAVLLLLLGATRYYYLVAADGQAVDGSSPAVNWARQVPAYFTSAMWIVFVAWLIIAPAHLSEWDTWSPNHRVSDVLGWIAVPFLVAGLWLFWYGHYTIGHYWSIQVRLKKAHRLVTHGPYRYVRHPLYTALFVAYLGTLLALQSWTLVAWFPVFVASYVLFAREEESVMERCFGEVYRAYLQQTGMFLPRWKRMRAAVAMNDETPARNRDSLSKVTGGID